jgi:phage shock protein C
MSISEELARLQELYHRGALTEAEFSLAKARLLDGRPCVTPGTAGSAINGLRRSRSDRWIGGVCGGLARSTGIESWAWRLIFVLLIFFGGFSLLPYLLMWIFVPNE